MSKSHRLSRNRRFPVKSGQSLRLNLTLKNADSLSLSVQDCSANGLSAKIPTAQIDPSWFEGGDIVPNSKIITDNNEIVLGRLVMRRVSTDSDQTYVAFSTIDSQLPISGTLSKYLATQLENGNAIEDKEISPDKFNLAHFVESENANADLFERVKEFSYFYREWSSSKKYAYKNVRTASKGQRVNLTRIRKNGRNDYLVMGSNDYFGLGSHPEVVNAAKWALERYGLGSTGSPVTTGTTDLHFELCEKIARIHGKEAALLYNSGYTANVGIITGITSNNDLIVADQLCHASIQDGMQMSRATSRFFKHNNADHLRTLLEKERGNYNGCLVITEGIFSMDGDVAQLDKIYAVAREFNCRLMVDQAHDFGVLGPNGLGVTDKYNLLKETDIIMGTFSKVCGAIGGFVTGSKDLINWLHAFSRPQIFTVSLPPAIVAAVSKSLDLITNDRTYVENLRSNIKHFVKGLNQIGFKVSSNHESSVVPVVIGNESIMGEMYQSLLDDGILCTPIVYPAVSKTNCRFRFTLTSNLTTSDLDYTVACLEKAMLKTGFRVEESVDTKKAG